MMKLSHQPSIASRASVRSLIVALMPAAAVAFVADLPALGAAFHSAADQGLTTDDNTGAGTNASATNAPGQSHGGDTNQILIVHGQRG